MHKKFRQKKGCLRAKGRNHKHKLDISDSAHIGCIKEKKTDDIMNLNVVFLHFRKPS
jgi:hypothetical protein